MKIIKATNLRLGKSVVGANFEFFRGEFIFIEGKSGSGKSELCRAFYGERGIDGGSLEVAGVSLRQARGGRLMRLRRQIGIVFADFKLVEDWSVERNIILPLLIAGHSKQTCIKQAAVFLKELGLAPKAALLPSSLSNGERQRVAIARALISAPQLLVCDEPFSHLDDYWAANVWSLMRQMQESSRKSAIIIATNKIPERFGFPFRRFVLEDGIIAERQIFRKASAE